MRLFHRLALAVALALSVMLLAPAAPAQAIPGKQITVCWLVGYTPWGHPIYDCHTIVIPELVKPPFPPGCIVCHPAFDFLDDKLSPEIRESYLDRLGKGFGLLSESALTEDPKVAAQLRQDATEAFLASAKVLEQHRIGLAVAGWTDQETGKFYKDDALSATGEHLTAGLGMMQQALAEPEPQPWIEEGMAQFDQALASLSKLYAG